MENAKRKKWLLRSMLFVPGHIDRYLEKAPQTGTDALILDLEDAVPAEEKSNARKNLRQKIQSGLFQNIPTFVRINDRESGLLLEDLRAVALPQVDGFVFPKVNYNGDIVFYSELLEQIERDSDMPVGKFAIVALMETSSGVLNALSIAQASNRVIALAFGCEDFIANLQGFHTREGHSIFVPRAHIVMAARAAGCEPIDTVYLDIRDMEGLANEAMFSKELGFSGMLILHPDQIEVAHRYYSPSDEQIADAQEMLRLNEEAHRQGRGVAFLNGKFIGPPLVIGAKQIMELAEQIRLKEQKLAASTMEEQSS